jgi:hypothetical protein
MAVIFSDILEFTAAARGTSLNTEMVSGLNEISQRRWIFNREVRLKNRAVRVSSPDPNAVSGVWKLQRRASAEN